MVGRKCKWRISLWTWMWRVEIHFSPLVFWNSKKTKKKTHLFFSVREIGANLSDGNTGFLFFYTTDLQQPDLHLSCLTSCENNLFEPPRINVGSALMRSCVSQRLRLHFILSWVSLFCFFFRCKCRGVNLKSMPVDVHALKKKSVSGVFSWRF